MVPFRVCNLTVWVVQVVDLWILVFEGGGSVGVRGVNDVGAIVGAVGADDIVVECRWECKGSVIGLPVVWAVGHCDLFPCFDSSLSEDTDLWGVSGNV